MGLEFFPFGSFFLTISSTSLIEDYPGYLLIELFLEISICQEIDPLHLCHLLMCTDWFELSFIIMLMSAESVVLTPLSIPVLVIFSFPFFALSIWLEIYQFY